jgi:Zn-dependent protease with chaperone function
MQTYQSALLMSLGFLGMAYFFKLLQFLVTKKKSVFTENDYRQDMYIFIIYYVGFYALFSFSKQFDNPQVSDNKVFIVFLLVVSQTFLHCIPYIILPLYNLLKSKYRTRDVETEKWVFAKFGKKYKVYIIEGDITNAYATGLLPFAKIILIGRSLIEKLTKEELEAIVAHEMGHLYKNHLLRAFVAQILLSVASSYVWVVEVSPILEGNSYYVGFMMAYFSLVLGLVPLYLLGTIQKRSEKEADAFSAQLAKPSDLISALNKFNNESKGASEKWSWNYPKLHERIENIEKSSSTSVTV